MATSLAVIPCATQPIELQRGDLAHGPQAAKAMTTRHSFATGAEVVAVYGAPRLARRRTLVRTRPISGEREIFQTSSGPLEGTSQEDLAVVPCDGSPAYPCKRSIFTDSWSETEPGSGVYRRSALARVVPVPEGHEAVLHSLEGELCVRHPDYIEIGRAHV